VIRACLISCVVLGCLVSGVSAAPSAFGVRCSGDAALCRSVGVWLYPQWRHAGEKGWSFNGGPVPSWSVKPRLGKTYWFHYYIAWKRDSVVAWQPIRSKVTVPGVRFDSGQSYKFGVEVVSGSSAQLVTQARGTGGGSGISLNGRMLSNPAKRSCPSVVVRAARRTATFHPICFPLH
jgi:hypothetical protein